MIHRLSQIDHTISAWLYQRPRQLDHIFGWLTLLGHPIVVTFIALLIGVAGLGLQQTSITMAFAVALVALALGSSLKFLLQRPRPSTPYADSMKQRTFSFPSGHSYGGALIYGLIAYLALSLFIEPWGAVTTIAIFPLILLIGFSRVYLGAHYLLDVIGGLLLSLPVLYFIINFVLV